MNYSGDDFPFDRDLSSAESLKWLLIIDFWFSHKSTEKKSRKSSDSAMTKSMWNSYSNSVRNSLAFCRSRCGRKCVSHALGINKTHKSASEEKNRWSAENGSIEGSLLANISAKKLRFRSASISFTVLIELRIKFFYILRFQLKLF